MAEKHILNLTMVLIIGYCYVSDTISKNFDRCHVDSSLAEGLPVGK